MISSSRVFVRPLFHRKTDRALSSDGTHAHCRALTPIKIETRATPTMNSHFRGILLGLTLMGLTATSTSTMGAEKALRPIPENAQTAIFAGGCFWCVEKDFDHVPGVLRTTSGYTGGDTKAPTYQQVSRGGTGHIEAVEIAFDPAKITYAELLEVFWRSVDPTDDGGQFCDRGHSYKTTVFTNSPEQQRVAQASKQALEKSGVLGAPVVTPITAAGPFYPAEGYHQNYYEKNPGRYTFYRFSCGRDRRVESLWGEQAHKGIVH